MSCPCTGTTYEHISDGSVGPDVRKHPVVRGSRVRKGWERNAMTRHTATTLLTAVWSRVALPILDRSQHARNDVGFMRLALGKTLTTLSWFARRFRVRVQPLSHLPPPLLPKGTATKLDMLLLLPLLIDESSYLGMAKSTATSNEPSTRKK